MVQISSASPGLQRAARLADREPHVDRGVDHVVVAERHLVGGQGGPAARAVRDDLVALVEQIVLPDPLQGPPDRLDVLVRQRHVGVVEVDPERDPLREPVPLLDVGEHRLAAALVELRDAVLLDLVLRGDAELALDLELDRQAVTVPARLAGHLEPAHRLVAGEDVLEDARQHVVRAGRAVGRRRPLVEHVQRRALAAAQRLVEHVVLAPARQDLLLERGEALIGVHGAVARHER